MRGETGAGFPRRAEIRVDILAGRVLCDGESFNGVAELGEVIVEKPGNVLLVVAVAGYLDEVAEEGEDGGFVHCDGDGYGLPSTSGIGILFDEEREMQREVNIEE